jgi:hypothetical protein
MGNKLERLSTKAFIILRREIEHLTSLSITEKLSHANTQDLVHYIKLIREMRAIDEALAADRKVVKAETTKQATEGQLEAIISRGMGKGKAGKAK